MDAPDTLTETEGEEISPQARAVAHTVLAQRPAMGLVHFTMRLERGPQGMLQAVWRITGWNKKFLAISDVPAPLRTSEIGAVFVLNPVFLNEDTRKVCLASHDRIHAIIGAFLRRETTYGSLQYVHISKAGRCKKVLKEMIAVNVSSTHAEFLGVETLLPDNYSLSTDLDVPRGPGVTLRASSSYPPQPPVAARSPPASAPSGQSSYVREDILTCWRWTVVDKSDAKHRGQRRAAKKRPQATCTNCGEADAASMRYDRTFVAAFPVLTRVCSSAGPDRPNTLCNQCGQRWRKEANPTDGTT